LFEQVRKLRSYITPRHSKFKPEGPSLILTLSCGSGSEVAEDTDVQEEEGKAGTSSEESSHPEMVETATSRTKTEISG
jgi:hypothetical protein